MEAVLNENLFNSFASKTEKKLKVLWPSQGTTAPTESNMVTILGSLLEDRDYAVFTEVPVTIDGKGGRIDLLAINEEQSDIVLFEAKSDKPSDEKLLQEMESDWNRLKSFSLLDLPNNNTSINNKIDGIKKHICVGFWSEHKERKINNSLFSPNIDFDYVHPRWIDMKGGGIGFKFFCKALWDKSGRP